MPRTAGTSGSICKRARIPPPYERPQGRTWMSHDDRIEIWRDEAQKRENERWANLFKNCPPRSTTAASVDVPISCPRCKSTETPPHDGGAPRASVRAELAVVE